ncbi:hypothetical protein GGR56DRAFT_156337 [Xylariaceae sp. FL0804]|nr:hypothetical protein GGR56DRAFT_156337 [Xylariaceae sp. FL0804]
MRVGILLLYPIGISGFGLRPVGVSPGYNPMHRHYCPWKAVLGQTECSTYLSTSSSTTMKPQQDHKATKAGVGVQATAVVAGAFLSGAMASLSMVTVPVFLDTNTDASDMVRQWARTYFYGHIILPGLCVGTCGLYGLAALRSHHAPKYALAATATFIMGTSFRTWRLGDLGSPPRASHLPWMDCELLTARGVSAVPFTWLFMAPTNNILFGLEKVTGFSDLARVRDLVVKWSLLHITRSVFPLVGAAIGLTEVLREVSG